MTDRSSTAAQSSAVAWLSRLHAGDMSGEESNAFEAWRQVPENRAAFAALSAVYERLDAVGDDPRIRGAREGALRRAQRRRNLSAMAIAAMVSAISISSVWYVSHMSPRQPAVAAAAIATEVGQTARVGLSDGSRLILDADTAIAVHFTGQRRDITIKRGRALFEVAKDPARAFVVTTRRGAVKATGTVFAVAMGAEELDVVLQEGTVAVSLPGTEKRPAIAPIAMNPGTRLTTDGDGWTLRPAVTDNALAWTRGFMVFDKTTLADAVAEMNHYSRRKIVLGPGLADEAISGTFQTGRQEEFAKALAAYGMVKIATSRTDEIVLSKK
jgi:transmembrane sensor